MSSPLLEIWEAASTQPFEPAVPKGAQPVVGITLLLISFVLSCLFGLNRSVGNIALLGIPASLAFGFGAVYMICAAGVFV